MLLAKSRKSGLDGQAAFYEMEEMCGKGTACGERLLPGPSVAWERQKMNHGNFGMGKMS